MNFIKNEININKETINKSQEDSPELMYKVSDESNDDNNDEPPELIGYGDNSDYDSSDSNNSDDDTDDKGKDKDDDFYDNPDPEVSSKMLATRQKIIKDRQRFGFKNQDHKLLKREDQLIVEKFNNKEKILH